MTNEELIKLYQSGDKSALDKLMENYRRIICKIANQYYVDKTNSMEIDDLIQEGFMGLMLAAKKYRFDIENPCSFTTYVIYWVKGEIGGFIKVSNTNDEFSLNVKLKADSEEERLNFIEYENCDYENIEEKIYQKELRAELEAVMNEANTLKEREIIKLHYSWDTGKEMTLKEIGDIFNETMTVVRLEEIKAFEKIRDTKWGKLKAKELFHERKLCYEWSITGTIEKINFAEKYLLDEVI